jgi:hypothetical protein
VLTLNGFTGSGNSTGFGSRERIIFGVSFSDLKYHVIGCSGNSSLVASVYRRETEVKYLVGSFEHGTFWVYK